MSHAGFIRIGATIYHATDKSKGPGKILRFVEHRTKLTNKQYFLVEVQWESGQVEEIPKDRCRRYPDRKTRMDSKFHSNTRVTAAMKNAPVHKARRTS